MHPSRLLFTASAVALLAACALGPDYKTPAPPGVSTYGAKPLPEKTASADSAHGAAQSFATGKDIPAEWWALFHSKPLDAMIAEAIKASPDLAAARAALRVAEENAAATEGEFYPTVTANFQTVRQKTSGAAFGGSFPGFLYTLHNASVNVSYGLDLFGGTRRAVEELTSEEAYQRFELEAAYLTLAGNIVTAAIREASLRDQIAATQSIIDDEARQLDVTQKQLSLGAVNENAVLAQKAALEQTKATLPALENALAQTEHLLSVLMGRAPAQSPGAAFTLADLTLPETLPVSLPSKLVEQRPDIRAADATLHAASAAIGIAEANRLPQITLSAGIGDESNNLGKLFSPGTGIWNMGFNVAQTIFDAGTLAHQQGAAEAQYAESAALYRKTVLAAFQDVADTLRALQSDADALKARATAEKAAADSLKLAQTQYDAGAISYLELLNAQQAEEQAKLALVQAEAQRFADTAALFQALGGGWWNRSGDITRTASANGADNGDTQ